MQLGCEKSVMGLAVLSFVFDLNMWCLSSSACGRLVDPQLPREANSNLVYVSSYVQEQGLHVKGR